MELAGHDLPLRVACRCGHSAKLDARAVWQVFFKRHWSGRLHMVGDHLKCSRCGARQPRVG